MSWDKDAPEHWLAPRESVESLNKAVSCRSEQYLFSHLNDRRVRRLAARFKDSKVSMGTAGFGPRKFAKIEVTR
jgi:hypothetical protein